jgi:hypothetical protein
MRGWLVIAGLVLLGALAFLVWPHGGSTALEHATRGANAREVDAARAPSLPEAAPEARETARETIAPRGNDVVVAPAADQRRWLVRGVVRGIPPDGEPARLRARFHGQYNIEDAAETQVGADGRVELEVTGAMETWLRHVDPVELRLEVEHARCLPGVVRLPFADARPDPADAHASVWTFELELVAAAIVTGRAIAPAGGVDAALYDRADPAGTQSSPQSRTRCDEDGRFTLRVARGGPWLLLLCAESALPQARALELSLGRIIDVGTIELQSGASLEGEVRSAGRPVGAGFTVQAWILQRPPGSRVLDGAHHVGYLHELESGEFLAHRRLARTDESGRFRIDGLADFEYALEVVARPDVRMSLGGPSAPEQVVRAPRAGLVLANLPPRLEIRPTLEGRAPAAGELEGATALLRDAAEGHDIAQLDLSRAADGYGGVAVRAGVDYALEVPRGRFAPDRLALGSFAFGEEREVALDLRLGPQPAELRVRLTVPVGNHPRRARFALVEVAGADAATSWDEVECGEDGSFDFPGLPPGLLRVLVRPHSPTESLEPMHWLDEAFEVALPPGAVVERELVLRAGGRMRVAARGEDGLFVRTPVELVNASGAKLATEFYCLLPGQSFGCGWYLCEQGVNDHPPLPPGRYTLTLRADGLAEQSETFDLDAGRTRLLEFVLRRP